MVICNITDSNGINKSISSSEIGQVLIDFGGGNFDIEYNDDLNTNLGYGSIVLTPENDFIAWVDLWGADGGSFGSNTVKDFGGIGGYTKVLMKFKEGINYTITAGQAGYFKNSNTHGGGASGYLMGGQGGGLTGVFINSNYYGKGSWNKDFNELSRENALAIAGGGGGKGGTTNSKQSLSGYGGGWESGAAYESGPSFQEIENSTMIGESPCETGNNGGGGGGWVGGRSLQNIKRKDHGASGGSGHIVYKEDFGVQPNNVYWDNIIAGKTEKGDYSRQDIFLKTLDKTKFTVISGSRNTINNKYKNVFVPQHGRFILTLANEEYEKSSYLQEIKPYATIG